MLDEDEESFGYDYEYYLLDGDNADKLGVMEDKDEAVEEDNYYYYSSTSNESRISFCCHCIVYFLLL